MIMSWLTDSGGDMTISADPTPGSFRAILLIPFLVDLLIQARILHPYRPSVIPVIVVTHTSSGEENAASVELSLRHSKHMVCILRWVFRKSPKAPYYLSSNIVLSKVFPLSWAPANNSRTASRKTSSSFVWIGVGRRVLGKSVAYPSTARSMAIGSEEGTNPGAASPALEDPLKVHSATRKLLTLVIIHHEGKVLLGMKKRGFGKGYYNGFGGKVEKGESIEEAAARELEEESGLTATDMEKRGILTFHFDNDPVLWEVHVYYVTDFLGDPCETEEMAPAWFPVADIPYDRMWSDDSIWYPLLLTGQQFKGDFFFTNTTTLTGHTIEVVDSVS
ncbi:hypothetical protein R1flu_012421 [Riccia fluitans]|uniref:Oxidized purine nucleoside triphosphate hydrolase n=1 Tax=Riccia fluitans TaxID=41844 RepID=A0ABD1ZAK2_9MARC